MFVGEIASQLVSSNATSKLFRLMSDPALVVEIETAAIVSVNPAAESLLHHTESELRGRCVLDLLRGMTQDGLQTALESALLECTYGEAASQQRLSLTAIEFEAGFTPTALLILKPLGSTTRMGLPELLLEEAQSVAGVGWWYWNNDTQTFYCSRAMMDLFNVPPSARDSIQLSTLKQQMLPQDHDVIDRCWHHATVLGQQSGSEYRIKLDDGSLRYLKSSARPVEFNADGSPRFVVGMLRDVSVYARNRELEQVAQMELEKFNEVLAAADGFLWEWNIQSQLFEFVSPNAERLLGYSINRWLTEAGFFARIIVEEDRERVLGFCAERTGLGLDHTMEYRMQNARGGVHWLRDHCFVKRDASGKPTHLHGLMIDITDRVRASELLQLGDERYQRLFYESPISLWELDCSKAKSALNELQSEGIEDMHAWLLEHPNIAFEIASTIQVLDVNRGTLTMFEADSARDFFQNVGGLFREESLPPYIGWLASLARGDLSYDFENVLYSLKTGQRMICSIRSRVARGSEQSFARTYSAVDNITQRKHTEHVQAAHRRILELIAARRPLAQVAEALLGEVELLSPYLCATLILPGWDAVNIARHFRGARFEQKLGSKLSQVNPDFLPLASDELGQIVLHDLRQTDEPRHGGESVAAVAVRHGLRDCGFNWCAVVRIGSSDEGCVGTLLVLSSSTEFSTSLEEGLKSFSDLAGVALEHAQAVGELMLRTAELQSVFDAYPDLLLRVSAQGDIVEVFGPLHMQQLLNVAEATTASLDDTFPKEIAARFYQAMSRIKSGSVLEVVELKVEHKGATYNIELRFVGLANSTDQMIVARETTLMRTTELKLRQMNHQFQRLFDDSPDAIFVETYDGHVLDANRAACELHQMTREQLLGRTVFELVPADERERVRKSIAEMAINGATIFEGSSLRSDGVVVPVSGRASRIEFGGQPALLLHVRDITAERLRQRRKQEQDRRIAHVSRLTMMGQLVAGIAHEIRQPLWSTNTFADVCQELLHQPNAVENLDRVRDLMSKLGMSAKRASEITTRMLSFARRGQPDRTDEKLSKLVLAAVELARPRLLSSNVSIRTLTTEHDPMVVCDRVLIEQTIVNLVNNACQALISKEHGRREIEIAFGADGDDAFVRVVDNGPGLPKGVDPEQLFESFFTTERTGTGIGLALSRSFVEEHGGRIGAKQNPSGGMTFEFTLKLTSEVSTHATSNSLHH